MEFLETNTNNTLAIWKSPMLTLLTNAGSTTARWNVTRKLFKPHQHIVNVLTCDVYVADESGGVTVESPAGLPKVGTDPNVPMLALKTSRYSCQLRHWRIVLTYVLRLATWAGNLRLRRSPGG